jgi:hypothetical protein
MRMNNQHPTPNRRAPCSRSVFDVECRALSFALVTTALPLFGQSSSDLTDSSAKLLPPYGELPPTYWEQNGTAVIAATLVFVALASFVVWWLLRPRPAVIVPPEAQARHALIPLLHRVEDGGVVSQVSQILRRYVIAAFKLPPGEPTTSEFCRAIEINSDISPELSSSLADFLRVCDERKFSTQPPAESIGAAPRALELVALAEARRAQLAQSPSTTEPSTATIPA